jgi:hypothetical protein
VQRAEYVGEQGLCDSLCRYHLLVFGQGFGIIDPYERGPHRDVLTTFDGYFLDLSVNTRGHMQPCCIDLALDEQRFRSQEIEDRKRDDDRRHDTDDDGRRTRPVRKFFSCPSLGASDVP